MIIPGKYRTRDGRTAVVLCTDAPGHYPNVGYVITKRENQAAISSPDAWTTDGYCTTSGTLTNKDLIEPITE